VTGAFLTCKAAIPYMESVGKGAIVNVSSVAGIRVGTIPYVAYCASKAALTHMTKALAIEYARKGIRVNNVMPGAIDAAAAREIWTDFAKRFAGGDTDGLNRSRVENTPMGRLGTPWDVANAALYLASDEADFVTGIDLIVDGGLACR
jgi:NAD(P)-dependent dehydrogenase (short-subunit alcohol dehydrogenase family)